MVDDQLIVIIERLRDDLQHLKTALRKKYRSDAQVNAEDLKTEASRLAERWMVEIAPRPEIKKIIQADYLANLNIHFQRILTFSEHATKKSRYETEIKEVLTKFTNDFIIPLKQSMSQAAIMPQHTSITIGEFHPTAFVGHSFAPTDELVVDTVKRTLETLAIRVVTGEKPKADRISEKVKKLIDDQYLFVGIFTRRDKVARKNEWTTSAWVIDEKAYAVGKSRKLILLKEKDVGSIGGIQGDYEFIEFSRDQLQDMAIKLIQMFDLVVNGLHP